MVAVLESIRRIVAEDAVHGGVTHEVYLRRETFVAIRVQDGKDGPPVLKLAWDGRPISILGLPCFIQNVGRDCIATLRNGAIISVTNLRRTEPHD